MAPKRRAQGSETEAPAKKAKSEATRRSARSLSNKTKPVNADELAQDENTVTLKKNSRKTANRSSTKTQNTDLASNTAIASSSEGPSFWLMKAEPESRLEKGKDVKFSIDDLAAVDKEPWDGVRNPVARNNMRAMKKGEKAFFYHSNCKIPGIAGIMEIEDEHSVDESAFDPKHPYYDEKCTRDNPKWSLVHVKFLRKLEKFISLKELQKFSQAGEKLANMQVLRMSRLSVSKVSKEEWEFVCRELAKIDPETLESTE